MKPAALTGMLATVSAHPLLAHLHTTALADLIARGHVASYRAKRTIVRAGTPADSVCFLLSGTVRVYHQRDASEVLLKLFRAPAMFGEIEVLERRPFGVNVATLATSCVLQMPASDFRDFLTRAPGFCLAAFEDMAARFWVASENLKGMAFLDVPKRLAGLLLDYGEFDGEQIGSDVVVRASLSQEKLARDLAVSRKAVQKALAELQDTGLVTRRAGKYVLTDHAALAARAGSFNRVSYSTTARLKQKSAGDAGALVQR